MQDLSSSPELKGIWVGLPLLLGDPAFFLNSHPSRQEASGDSRAGAGGRATLRLLAPRCRLCASCSELPLLFIHFLICVKGTLLKGNWDVPLIFVVWLHKDHSDPLSNNVSLLPGS